MKKILLSILTVTTLGFGAMAQLPAGSFFEYEFTGGSLNNTSSSGAPNFTGSITSIADRNGSANDAADITGSLGGASVGATNVNEMTLSFWMKHGPISSNERILQIYGTGGRGFRLQMTGSQLLYNATIGGNNSSSISSVKTATVNIDNSVWHHIAVRTTLINASILEFDIFLDNVLVPNLSNTTLDIEDYQNGLSITNFLMNANLTISPTNAYSGDIDDIYFYKSALTDAQITQLYNYSPPPCTVTIPDVNFKAYLVGNTAINTNGDTEIQCSEASAYTGVIACSGLSISDLTGIEAFTALTSLNCEANTLTSLNVSQNIALMSLKCGINSLTNLSVSNNTALTTLWLYDNSITSIDVSNNSNLEFLSCWGNGLTNINVSLNTALTRIYCQNNALTSLNIANGNNNNFIGVLTATGNPNLTCVQVDNVSYSTTNWPNGIDATASYSTNCGTVGINELSNESLSVYPNPAKNQLTITNNQSQILNISIIDITGKTVKTIIGNVSTVNVSGLTKGIYFLQVQTEKGLLNSKFIRE
ncbi:MAG: T9SS type A sorting domain-containing protein [Flavobacteriales bacterium]|nr:T9SS type A sorting domain-containing protein [Flavobacteriales bacterium]